MFQITKHFETFFKELFMSLTLPEKLKLFREKRDLLKSALADMLEISSQLLGMYEAGSRRPKSDFYEKWKDVFEFDLKNIASAKKPWYVSYRFYDAAFPKPKQVMIRRMNIYKTVQERRQITQELIENELDLLQNKGYNPITESYRLPVEQEGEIFPHTLFIDALKKAKEKVILNTNTAKELRLVLNHVESAAKVLRKDRLRISDVEIKDILIVLEEVGKNSRVWSSYNFNKHRAYLMILFKQLIQYGAVKYNPAAGIAKRKMIKKIRKVLTDEERIIVKEHLQKVYPAFYRFMQCFFHSGARETEILSVTGKHVNLSNQTFVCLIKKGNEYREVAKIIKDIALPFWSEAVHDCRPDEFIFSRKFKPGRKQLSANKINKTWNEFVKVPLNITADMYSLKHSNTTEIAAILSDEQAAKINSHQSIGMVVSIYDVNRKNRKDAELKKVNNPL